MGTTSGQVGPSWSVLGAGGLTLARPEVPDRDVQALAAGDGSELALAAVGDSIRPTHLGHRARMPGVPSPPYTRHPPHTPSLTLVALASGQVGVGHTQWAEPASSTQEAPNSQCISAQVRGTEESGTDTGDPLAPEAASVMATPPAQVTTRTPPAPAPPTPAGPSPVSQPAGPRPRPSGHCPHLGPATPGLQEHSPVICSQSSRTAPRGSQLQAEGTGRGLRSEPGTPLAPEPSPCPVRAGQSPRGGTQGRATSGMGRRAPLRTDHGARHSRVQPLRPSVTMPRKFQKPGSQRSHLKPPTPGRQEHWPVPGSQVPP